ARASTSGATGGVDSGSPCVPSADGSIVLDDCGVFVRAGGSDNNPGTKDAPVKTIGEAIERAEKGSGRSYACAESFSERGSLDGAIEIFGGLECKAGWVYPGNLKTTLAPPQGVPLTLRPSASGARISDFAIVAPDAATPGDSSIAVIADGV